MTSWCAFRHPSLSPQDNLARINGTRTHTLTSVSCSVQATHEAQLEEFEATRQIVEESVAASSVDIELL